MTTTKLMLSAAAAALITAPAFAGGMNDPVEAPAPVAVAPMPVAPSTDWTGFYLGGSIGTGDVTPDGAADIDQNNYGLHAGYNYDLGNVVVGGELEYARLNLDAAGDPEANVTRLKARVGYDAGNILPYATAGYASLDSDDLGIDSEDGYFYGVGADFAVTDSILVGAEVLQHDFEDAGVEAQTFGLRASYKF